MPVTFAWGNNTFEINNPEFGNTNTLEFTRIARQSRGNDNLIARDNEWPEIERFTLTFDVRKQAEADKFRQMVRDTLGDYLQYTHTDGETYDALILNPDTAIAQSGRFAHVIALNLEVTIP